MDFYTARDKGEPQVFHQTSTEKILKILRVSQYGSLELDSMVTLRNKHLGEHRAAQASPGHGNKPLQGVNRGIIDFKSDKPQVTPISEAVLNEDLEALKAAIQSFGNPPIESEQILEPNREAWIKKWRMQHLDGYFNENKVNALVLAAEKGMTEHVRLLLEAQASVNYETKASATPLVYAIHRQCVSVVSLLLEAQADPCHNVKDTVSPAAPIHLACKSGCLKIVKMLINHNADLSTLDGLQNTPLITSIHFSRPQVANYLLTHALQAKMSERNNNSVERYDNLLKKDHQSMHGTALTQALEKKFFSTADLLFKYGADPNLSKRDGVNPLLISTWMGHRGMVKLCIDNKANPNYVITTPSASASKNLIGMNALKFAANKRHFHILKQLLESEVRVFSH
jgi:ankyrin repeat protein